MPKIAKLCQKMQKNDVFYVWSLEYMTDYAGSRDYVENVQTTSNILGTVLLTVTQPHCESDDPIRIVLDTE